jgi:hypothetical protein
MNKHLAVSLIVGVSSFTLTQPKFKARTTTEALMVPIARTVSSMPLSWQQLRIPSKTPTKIRKSNAQEREESQKTRKETSERAAGARNQTAKERTRARAEGNREGTPERVEAGEERSRQGTTAGVEAGKQGARENRGRGGA